MKAAPTCFG